MIMTDPATAYGLICEEVATVLVGNEKPLNGLSVTLLTHKHVLRGDIPDIAKTSTTDLFGTATGLNSGRVQIALDSLTADITGTHVSRELMGESALQRGPKFSNFVVVDKINRPTAKTQFALLEAMQEFQVAIEGETLELLVPLIVIAPQSPIETKWTFELPKAQRDRYTFKLTIVTPARMNECELFEDFDYDATLGLDDVDRVLSGPKIVEVQAQVREIHVADSVKDYILDIIRTVCESSQVEVGASLRASLTFLNKVKAPAAIHGREYATPDDVKSLLHLILRHRIVPSTEADLSEQMADEILMKTGDNVSPSSESVTEDVVTPV